MNFAVACIICYPFVGIVCAALFRARLGILITLFFGMLFLPPIGWDAPGAIPTVTKLGVVSISALIVLFVRGFHLLRAVRWHWLDLPVVVFVLSAPLSSLANNYGIYDAGSQFVSQLLHWGVPYLIGRAVLSTPEALRDLVVVMLWSVAVYLPLIVLEMFISPQLQSYVFDLQTFKGATMYRFGGWRPVVFFQHGISLGLYVAMASVGAWWLFDRRSWRGVYGAGFAIGMPVLTLLSRALGGVILLFFAVLALLPLRFSGVRVGLICLILIAPGYTVVRAVDLVPIEPALAVVKAIDVDRAASFAFRLENEAILRDRALQRPLLGWATHGLSRGETEVEQREVVTDSYWIIVMGSYGLLGLVSGMLTLSLGSFLFVLRVRAAMLTRAAAAAPVAVLCMISLYSIDLLMNGFLLPITHFAAGGMAGLSAFVLRRKAPSCDGAPRRGRAAGSPAGRTALRAE